jgi:hypothetical protein
MTKGGRDARRQQLSAVQRQVATTTTEYKVKKKKALGVTYGKKVTKKEVADPNEAVQVADASKTRIATRTARAGVANVQQNSRFSARRPRTGSLRIDVSGAQVSGGRGGVI